MVFVRDACAAGALRPTYQFRVVVPEAEDSALLPVIVVRHGHKVYSSCHYGGYQGTLFSVGGW
jgi:hypothetical protein